MHRRQSWIWGSWVWTLWVSSSNDHGSVCVGHNWDVQCSQQVKTLSESSIYFFRLCNTFLFLLLLLYQNDKRGIFFSSFLLTVFQKTSLWSECPHGSTFGCWAPSASPCPSTSLSSMLNLCLWVKILKLHIIKRKTDYSHWLKYNLANK